MKHIHKYRRINIASKGKEKYNVFKCMEPDCNHYLPQENLIIGRKSICFSCGNSFIVKTKNFAKAVCEDCKGHSLESKVEDILKDIGVI